MYLGFLMNCHELISHELFPQELFSPELFSPEFLMIPYHFLFMSSSHKIIEPESFIIAHLLVFFLKKTFELRWLKTICFRYYLFFYLRSIKSSKTAVSFRQLLSFGYGFNVDVSMFLKRVNLAWKSNYRYLQRLSAKIIPKWSPIRKIPNQFPIKKMPFVLFSTFRGI